MLTGALKASPIAAIIGAVSAKDALAYAGIISIMSSILIIGAIWNAAKAWKMRAEARTDQAEELAEQAVETAAQIKELQDKVLMLEGRTDVVAALAPLVTWANTHEANAKQRHDAQMEVLERLILHIDPEGAGA